MDISLRGLPYSARGFLLLQTGLAAISLFFIFFEALYLSPQQQRIALNRVNSEIATQLQLISPLTQKKISRLLTANSALNTVDRVEIIWQDQQWQFNHARNSTQQTDAQSKAHKQITFNAPIYALDGQTISGQLIVSTQIQYRFNYLLGHSVALLAILISVFFTLYSFRVTKETGVRETKNKKTTFNQQLKEITSETKNNNDIEKTELFLAKKTAQEASRIKSTIIANTSHELLTPLNSIVGFSNILLDKKMSDEQKSNLLTRINDNALHLSALVNDLLDFSIRSNRILPLNYQSTDIHALLLSISNSMAYEAQSKNLAFITDFDDLFGYEIHTDPLRLRQLISNLAINAIRYTNNGHVKISARFDKEKNKDNSSKDKKTLLLCVEDTGVGIAKDQQDKVFSSFFSTGSSTKSDNNPGLGLGLGLSIVATISQRMGATIDFESELGLGTCFNVSVPIKQYKTLTVANKPLTNHLTLIDGQYPPALSTLEKRLKQYTKVVRSNDAGQKENIDLIIFNASKEEVDALNSNNDESKKAYEKRIQAYIALEKPLIITAPIGLSISNQQLLNNSNIRIINGPFAIQSLINTNKLLDNNATDANHRNEESYATPQLKTLVVDDNISNVELLSFLLTNMHCDVDSATNGKDALALINEHNYDWLFIDIRMQPMDGIELVKAIRQLDSYQSAPIIACTAHTSDEEFRVLIDAGFDKVTHKPIMEQQIKALKGLLFESMNGQASSTEQASLSVFNIDQAIRKTDGNIKNARRIFELFLNEIEQAITVKNQVADDKLENIIDFVHKLHGAAAMTGTTALKNQLNQCETVLKNLPISSNPTSSSATSLSDTTDSAIKKELEDVYQQIGLVLEWYKNNHMNNIFETGDN